MLRLVLRIAIGGIVVAAMTLAVVGVLGVVVIVLLSHGEPLGGASVDTTFEDILVLNADHPVAVRALVVSVDPAGVTLPHVGFSLEASPYGPVAEGAIWTSVIDPLTGQALTVTSVSPAGAGVSRDLTDACGARTCSETFVLVSRLLPPYPGSDLKFNVRATLGVESLNPQGLPSPLPSHLTVAENPAFAFNGRPSTLTTDANGSFHLTGSAPGQAVHLSLKIPAAALRGPLMFPVIGRLIVRPETATASDTTLIEVTVGGPHGQKHANLDLVVVDYEWLSACRPAVDCVVPIDLTPHLRELYSSSAAPTSWAEGTWSVEARLEVLNSSGDLPNVPLTLEQVTP